MSDVFLDWQNVDDTSGKTLPECPSTAIGLPALRSCPGPPRRVNSLRQGATPPAHRASKFVRKCVQDLISQSKQKRPTINRNLRIYQNHPNMSDTPLGSPAGWEGTLKTVFLGHHLRKRSEKEGTGAVHEKNTKVCRNLVPQWEASGRDNEILGTILGARRVGKGPQNPFLGDHLGKRREKGGTEAVHEKNKKFAGFCHQTGRPRTVITGLPFDTCCVLRGFGCF